MPLTGQDWLPDENLMHANIHFHYDITFVPPRILSCNMSTFEIKLLDFGGRNGCILQPQLGLA